MAELSGDVFITQETADEEEVVLFSGMLAQRYLSVPGPSVSKEIIVFSTETTVSKQIVLRGQINSRQTK